MLRVDPLPASRPPLPLGTRGASGLVGRDVATIGHPVRDERGDILLQDRVFSRRYNVKRLQPGKILGSAAVRSFGREVVAMTHDCSTLGGNSGSPVCDLESGEIVGLHFAGQQFVANYSVPTAALASDPRLAPLGLTFVGDPPPSAPAVDLCVAEAWRLLG